VEEPTIITLLPAPFAIALATFYNVPILVRKNLLKEQDENESKNNSMQVK